MSVLEIKKYPDPTLTLTWDRYTITFPESREQLETLGKDLLETMLFHKAVGIASRQVGSLLNVIVITVNNAPIICYTPCIYTHTPDYIPRYLPSNYEKILSSDKATDLEGCLSIPGIQVRVLRYNECILTYNTTPDVTNVENRTRIDLSGYEARIAQHEYDHLKGILIIDHIESPLAKKLTLEKYFKLRKREEKDAIKKFYQSRIK